MATNNSLNNSSAPFTVSAGNLTVTAGNIDMPTSSSSVGVYYINSNPFMHNVGTNNTFLGANAGNLSLHTAGHVGIGANALASLSLAEANVGIGFNALNQCVSGNYNIGIGSFSLAAVVSGAYNVAIGLLAGNNYTGAESSNVLINSLGVASESNVMRIGVTGSGNQEVNTTYIAGISGVNVGSVASVVSISGDKLGSTTITAGTGISVTPGANSITIANTGVTGPGSSTTRDIATFDGTSGTVLYDNPGVTISSSGYFQNSHQPAFMAVLESNDPNVTGNGQEYQMGGNVPLTTIFDQTSSFGGSEFTAPVTGKYFLHSQVIFGDCTIGYSFSIYIVTDSNTYQTQFERTASGHNGFGNNTVITPMTAGDLAYVVVQGVGETGNTQDLNGGSESCLFTGYLVC